MGNTGRNRHTKVRHYVTSQGCVVAAERTQNQQTACIDEDIELSHPRPILEVAYTQEGLIAKANGVFEKVSRL